jgi:hypothetical protein
MRMKWGTAMKETWCKGLNQGWEWCTKTGRNTLKANGNMDLDTDKVSDIWVIVPLRVFGGTEFGMGWESLSPTLGRKKYKTGSMGN